MSIFDRKLVRRVTSFADKQTCLREMVGWLHEQQAVIDRRVFLHDLKEREQIMPTGIGRGVALPHARSEAAIALRAAACVLEEPLSWDSLDGKPVCIVLMAAVPADAGTMYMKFMQSVSEFCRSEANRNALLHAETDEDVLKALQSMETDTR